MLKKSDRFHLLIFSEIAKLHTRDSFFIGVCPNIVVARMSPKACGNDELGFACYVEIIHERVKLAQKGIGFVAVLGNVFDKPKDDQICIKGTRRFVLR